MGRDRERHSTSILTGRVPGVLAALIALSGCGASQTPSSLEARRPARCSAGWPAVELELRAPSTSRVDTIDQQCVVWSSDAVEPADATWRVVIDVLDADEPGTA